MATAAHHHRPMRLLAVASGGLTLVVALAAAASPSAPRDAVARTRAAAGARAPAPDGTWGTAMEVPDTAALNTGGFAHIAAVSCAQAGACSAGGFYTDASGHRHAFVAGEAKGIWGPAQEVPGTAALDKGGDAQITALSCARAGACSAGGIYTDASGHGQAFVAGEAKGSWRPAQELPGTAALNKGGLTFIAAVSCGRAGTCSAGGSYTDASGHNQAFVAGEAKGSWGPAQEVPGTAALNKGDAQITALSCARAGACSAGGSYTDASGHGQAFVAGEAKGSWGPAQEVPGTAALNKGGFAEITAVSCGRAGTCSAGGDYTDASGGGQVFVAGETKGSWGPALEVPGTAALNKGGLANITAVSCGRAGACSAGGDYIDAALRGQAFVVNKT